MNRQIIQFNVAGSDFCCLRLSTNFCRQEQAFPETEPIEIEQLPKNLALQNSEVNFNELI
jgi:hypothetical protein